MAPACSASSSEVSELTTKCLATASSARSNRRAYSICRAAEPPPRQQRPEGRATAHLQYRENLATRRLAKECKTIGEEHDLAVDKRVQHGSGADQAARNN